MLRNLLSDNVIKDGSSSESYPDFEDEPQEGKIPNPPEPPEEKKPFNWGKLALAAVATVAVVASVATFGLGATLAIIAVSAVAVAAATEASKAGAENIQSQLDANGGDSSKIDYGEVLKAQFKGAITGAKDMIITEGCVAYDALDQTASSLFDICTLGAFHNSCKDFSEWSHEFFKNIAPYKDAYEGLEYLTNVALMADGMFNIGNAVNNGLKGLSGLEFSTSAPELAIEGFGSLSTAIGAVGEVVTPAVGTAAVYNNIINNADTSILKTDPNIQNTSSNSSPQNTSPKKEKVKYGEQYTRKGRKKVLKPDVEYTTKEGYKYSTNSQGKLSEVEGTLKLDNGKRNNYAQSHVGKGNGRLDTDDGGHLIATIFKGSGNIDNLVPMDATLNRGQWKVMENKWANALKSNEQVEVKIKINYNNPMSDRPASFNVKYKIGNGKWISEYFVNK